MLQDLFTFAIANGLPQDTLLLLLLLPSLALLVVFFRVVIGLSYLSVHRGIFLALGVSFVGLRYGGLFLIITFLLDFFIRAFLESRRLLPPAKDALSLLFLSLVFLAIFITSGYFTKEVILSLDILPIILLLVSAQGMFQINPGDHPLRPFLWLLGIGLFLSGSFFIITWAWLHAFILSSPLLYIGIVGFLLIFLARFPGLRVVEFFRFFRVLTRS
ncbi:MAG: hypothetical protein HYZ69_02200 [Candidatus Colwellbacteria bacterium]|nr:hypothetical protein [Candidatus Colwellbacteria bacterium]